MTRRLLTLVGTVLAAVAIAGAARPNTGVVVDTRGKPIPGARVYAFLGEKPNSKKIPIHVDGKGKFKFNPPAPGRYYYLADAKGYAFAMACDRRVNPGKITLKLWPEAKLPGQVVDLNGKPVAGATVGIHAFDAWDSPADSAKLAKPWIWFRDQPSFVGSVKTDKYGKFTIGRLPNLSKFNTVRLRLDVTAPGRALAYKFFNKREVASRLKLVSAPGCTLTGTISMPDKSQIPPRSLGVMASYALPGPVPGRSTVYPDADGRYEFKNLPPGPVTISIGNGEIIGYDEATDQPLLYPSPDWDLQYTPRTVLAPGTAGKLDIVLAKGAVVKGKVIDKATGKPVEGGYMRVTRVGQSPNVSRDVPIQKDGQFTLKASPGTLRISVNYCQINGRYVGLGSSGNDAEGLSQEVTLAEGEEKCDLVFEVDTSEMMSNYFYMGSAEPLPTGFQLKPGTYKLTWNPNSPYFGSPYYSGGDNGQARDKMTKLPELKSKKPIYGITAIDGTATPLYYIFDQSTETGKSYDTLYVDANRNGDLTDDKPVTWKPSTNYSTTPWVEVQAHQGAGDGQTSNPIRIRWTVGSNQPMEMMRKGAWVGTVDTSAGKASVILVDSNSNGLYNDALKGSLAGSRESDAIGFRASLNSYSDTWQPLIQGGPAVVGSKAYIVTASASGSEITIKPYTGHMGSLIVRKISLAGRSGQLSSIDIRGANGSAAYRNAAGKTISLPVGDYSASVSITMGTGSKAVDVYGSLAKPIHIKPNGKIVLDIVGKPRLNVMDSSNTATLKPGTEQRVSWSYDFGDVLKGASLYTRGSSNTAVAKARFDRSLKSIAVSYKPGGG